MIGISDLRFLNVVDCGYIRPLFSIYIISAEESSVASLTDLYKQEEFACTEELKT